MPGLKAKDPQDIVGLKFGKLSVDSIVDNGKRGYWYKCFCDCGNSKEISRQGILKPEYPSCGCGNTKHGMVDTIEYCVWQHIKNRCTNPKDPSYHNYGARGIFVCQRWLEPNGQGFLNFFEDMGPRVSTKHTIERKDPNKEYSPDNCIWTDDRSLQSYNTRIRSDNTSGKTGVSYDSTVTSRNKWRVQIYYKNISKKKRFEFLEDAIEQRIAWEIELYGFTVE